MISSLRDSRALIFLRAFCAFIFLTFIHFLRALVVFTFLRALHALIFLRDLRAFSFLKVSYFRRALSTFTFFHKIWNNPEPSPANRNKQEGAICFSKSW